MPYGSVLTDTVQSSTAGTPPQFNDGNGTQVGTLCRAWVNFNGTTSPGTIRGSFNVTSVTKVGTGQYTVNFTNALPDANYAVTGLSDADGNGQATIHLANAVPPTSSSCRIAVYFVGVALQDHNYNTVAFFR